MKMEEFQLFISFLSWLEQSPGFVVMAPFDRNLIHHFIFPMPGILTKTWKHNMKEKSKVSILTGGTPGGSFWFWTIVNKIQEQGDTLKTCKKRHLCIIEENIPLLLHMHACMQSADKKTKNLVPGNFIECWCREEWCTLHTSQHHLLGGCKKRRVNVKMMEDCG